MRNLLRVVAKTKPARQRLQFFKQELRSEECYWVSHRWARFVRWMCRKRWLRKLVPYPLECFANASEVTLAPSTWELPSAAIESIHQQMCGLFADGQEPSLILVGRETHYELLKSDHYSMMPIMVRDSGDDTLRYRGVKMVVTNKLEPNSVLVIA